MPQNERLRVWKGELKKTSGGLRKQDLIKNRRGKIVSKKKLASKTTKLNNLAKGGWLRSKGEMFLSKGLKPENIIRKNKPGRKSFKAEPKEQPKVQPKKAAAPKKGVQPAKKKVPPKISKTVPMEAGEKKDMSKISVGNIIVKKVSTVTAKQKWVRRAKLYKKKMKKGLFGRGYQRCGTA